MKVMFSGAIFMFLHFLLFCAIRVDGRPNYSMGMICFAAILNIILDYVFVFPLGMGIKGAAIATVISEFLEFLIGLYYFLSNKSFMKLNFKISWIKFDILKNIIKFGFPPFIIDLTFGVQNLFLNIQLLKYGGDLAVAAMGVVFAAITFVVLPVIGLCDGMQPIVGYNFGAKKPKRIKKTLIKAIIFSTILGVFGQALVQLFSEDVASLFTKDKELIKVAQTGLLLYLAMMFTAGIQNSLSSFLPCIEKAKSATFFSIIRQAIIFLGLLYILPRFFGLKGVWLTMPVADFLGTIITIIWIAYELKNLNKMKEKK
jgi:putative MATE family efflux protein